MKNNRKPYFNSNPALDKSTYWYVTLVGDDITRYSNGSYLGADVNSKKAKGEEFMKTYKFSKTFIGNEYFIYYGDYNNVLTISGKNAVLAPKKGWFFTSPDQKFKFVEENVTL